MSAEDIPARLEYLRGEIRAERISYSELSELQGLAAHIDAGDSELLQWAGVPEDAPEDAPFIKGGTLESTNPGAPYTASPEHVAADKDHAPVPVSAYGDNMADNCGRCGLAVTADGKHHGFSE